MAQTTIEAMACEVERHPDYRVLRRLQQFDQFASAEGRTLSKGIVLDTETTGLDQSKDRIIEFCMVAFDFDPLSGEVVRITGLYDGLEDPGIEIPALVSEITGITSDMVKGKRIDEGRVAALADSATIVIAHNAAFDRPFVEQRLPLFANLAWACSHAQVPWRDEGVGSTKLDYIASQYGFFYDAHRAEADCRALLEILRKPLPKTRRTALAALLAESNQLDCTVFALNSRFETKDLLKGRGYRWNADRKVWYRPSLPELLLRDEKEWLKTNIYNGRSAEIEYEIRDASSRFSRRAGRIERVAI